MVFAVFFVLKRLFHIKIVIGLSLVVKYDVAESLPIDIDRLVRALGYELVRHFATNVVVGVVIILVLLLRYESGQSTQRKSDLGDILIFRTFPLDSMTEETLSDELGKLVDQVVDWQRLLEGFDAAEEDVQATSEEENTITHSPEGFIQV